MSWGALIQAGVAAYGANRQNKAAKEGAQASQEGTDASIEEQRRQFDITQRNMQPNIDAGHDALARMQAYNNGDYSGFYKTPDYQFTLDEGLRTLDRSAAAKGSLFSGGHSADLMKYGQGMASQQYGTQYSRLSDLATGGNATAGSLGTLGANMANGIGNLTMGNALNQRNSAYDRSNAYTNMGDQMSSSFGSWYNGLGRDGQGAYLGNNRGRG